MEILNNSTFTIQLINGQNVFEISQNYDLDGETLDLSSINDCVLRFRGGMLLNGNIKCDKLLIECGPVQCFSSIKFVKPTNASFDTFILNDFIDVRWFGIKPNDNTLDCKSIVNDMMMLQKPMFFPRGRFYFSELCICNSANDRFAIIGEQSYGLGFPTEFYPMDTTQRYIIKIGGGSDYLGQNENHDDERGYNIKIEHIAFRWTTNASSQAAVEAIMNQTPHYLLNNYGNSSNLREEQDEEEIDRQNRENGNYLRSALILDRVQKGHFDISGGNLVNIPLLTICYAYECDFENIKMYHNEGRSNLPIIQVINGVTCSISTFTVRQVMFENVVGPLIKTFQNSSISELIINNIFFEQTAAQTISVGSSEQRYDETPDNFDTYERVPCFDFNGYGTILIDNMVVSCANATWLNQFDPHTSNDQLSMRTEIGDMQNQSQLVIKQVAISSVADTTTNDRIRSFVRFAHEFTNYTNLHIKCLYNSMKSRYAYIEGGFEKGSQSIKVDNQIGVIFVPVNGGTRPFVQLKTKDNFLYLVNNYQYKDLDLISINNPYLVSGYGFTSMPFYDESKGYLVLCKTNSHFITNQGIKLERHISHIVVEYFLEQLDGYTNIGIEYFDENDILVTSETFISLHVTNFRNVRTTIIPIKRNINFSYVKLKNSSVAYGIRIRSVCAYTQGNVPIVDSNNTQGQVVGNRFVQDGLTYEFNGQRFLLDNKLTRITGTQESSGSNKILKINLNNVTNIFLVRIGYWGANNLLLIHTDRANTSGGNSDLIQNQISIKSIGASASVASAIAYYNNGNVIEIELDTTNIDTTHGYAPEVINLYTGSTIEISMIGQSEAGSCIIYPITVN